MESNFLFHKYPSQNTLHLHPSTKKYTHCFTLLIHLLICSFCFSFVVSSPSWDGITITKSNLEALKSFKQELIDPDGFLMSWNGSGYGACSGGWVGIKCVQGQVIVIQLPWRGLGGQLTSKIGQLQALRKLSLHDNAIGGSIPKELGFLPNLRGVQLFNNKFTGAIPYTLGSCTLLQNIDFSNNSLVGGIPDSLGNCTMLYNVNLSLNSMSNSIPVSLIQSNSLMFLSLQYNNFSGLVPDSWGGGGNGGKPMVKSLTFDHNFFNGKIPASLSKLTEIELISFSYNQFDDEIPTEIGNLLNLKSLDLSYNYINGGIPNSFANLSSLISLNLAHNNLTGQIPVFIGGLLNLSVLNVSYNNLSGHVPIQLSSRFHSNSFIHNLELCGYSPSTACPTSPAKSHQCGCQKSNAKDALIIAGGALIAALLLLCCMLLYCLLKKEDTVKHEDGQQTVVGPTKEIRTMDEGEDDGGKLVIFEGGVEFTADDLLCASAEVLAKSGYGTCYKASLVEGKHLVVKRLREGILRNQIEFENEVNLVGMIRHQNLLAMMAYYCGPNGEKLLVFDYMPKGSLASFLHVRGHNAPFNWPTRMRTMKGITRGLLNLHTHHNIIHGNLTSNNVLLDDELNPKIADYGLLQLMTSATYSNVSGTVGAHGYQAPEHSKLKKANTKTDVYSLGVIMLELLTGKSPREVDDGVGLPQWVASIVNKEWTNEVFDLLLMKDAFVTGDELLKTLKLALQCVGPSPSARPEVQLILQQLEDITPEVATSSSGEDGGDPSTGE